MIVSGISIGELLATASTLTVLITWLWNGIGKPNKEQDERIIKLEDCALTLEKDINLIKVNHLSHIEKDIRGLREGMVKVETILNERLPGKQ